jgi:uncharacterized protein (DUF697 family)
MNKNTTASAEAPAEPQDTDIPTGNEALPMDRTEAALKLVKSYMPWSAGAGIIPVPGIDLTALVAVQLRMLAKLAELYNVPFRDQAAKSVLGSLLGAVASGGLAGGVASTFKAVPVIGTLVGALVLPALGAAATYAVGKVFITHFESGGTFLDLDPAKVQEHFRKEFEQARADASADTKA